MISSIGAQFSITAVRESGTSQRLSVGLKSSEIATTAWLSRTIRRSSATNASPASRPASGRRPPAPRFIASP